EHRLAAALAKRQGEFAGGGGLALTLEAAEHDDRRPVLGKGDVGVYRPHQGDQLVVDDLDDLLAGIEGTEDLLAERALLHALDEVVGDGVVDVRVEQGFADLLQAVAHVRFGEPAAATQFLQGLAETTLDAFKHGCAQRFNRRTERAGSAAAGPDKAVNRRL